MESDGGYGVCTSRKFVVVVVVVMALVWIMIMIMILIGTVDEGGRCFEGGESKQLTDGVVGMDSVDTIHRCCCIGRTVSHPILDTRILIMITSIPIQDNTDATTCVKNGMSVTSVNRHTVTSFSLFVVVLWNDCSPWVVDEFE